MIGTDAMSGEDTDDEDVQGSAIEQKELVRVPVRWLNPGIVEMLHTVDTWKQLELDEKLGDDDDQRGPRPLKRKRGEDKSGPIGPVTKNIPKNWYNDLWFNSLPAGHQAKYQARRNRDIPTPVRSITALYYIWFTNICVASLLATSSWH